MINKEELVGVWEADSNKEYGQTSLEFKADGSLTYSVSENDKKQIINLIYWIENEFICTDQPSAPKVEKTLAKIENGKLVMEHDGVKTYYSKK